MGGDSDLGYFASCIPKPVPVALELGTQTAPVWNKCLRFTQSPSPEEKVLLKKKKWQRPLHLMAKTWGVGPGRTFS